MAHQQPVNRPEIEFQGATNVLNKAPRPGRDLKKRIMAQDRSIFLTSSSLRSSFITQLNCLFRDRTTVYDVYI